MIWLLLVLGASPLEQAQALEQRGDDAEAVRVLEAAVRDQPAWSIGRIELGRLELKRGEPEQALQQLDIARSLALENPRAHYLFALAAFDLGRAREGRGALEVALALRPDYADAQLKLGSTLLAEGDAAGAVQLLGRYAQAHPDANGARLQYAEALERSGELKRAEKELKNLFGVPALRQLAGRRLMALYEATNRHAEAVKLDNELTPDKRQMRELKPSRR